MWRHARRQSEWGWLRGRRHSTRFRRTIGIRPAAWTSPNGVTWTRSDTSSPGLQRCPLRRYRWANRAGRGRHHLPAGVQRSACRRRRGYVDRRLTWESTHGHRVRGARARSPRAAARCLRSGMLQGDGQASALQVWRSSDGVAWSRVGDPPAIPDLSSYRTRRHRRDAGSRDRRRLGRDHRRRRAWRNFAFAASTAAPSGELAPIPTATPPPSVPVASAIDAEMELRVEIRPDVSVGRMPMMTVYRDGTVLRRGNLGGVITRLDADGLERLLAEATDSGLFATSGTLAPDPDYQGGVATTSIDLRRGDDIVHRETTNAMAPAVRAEGERLIALGEHLADLEAWLPADAWDDRSGRRRAVPGDELPPEGHDDEAAGRGIPARGHGSRGRRLAVPRQSRGLRRDGGGAAAGFGNLIAMRRADVGRGHRGGTRTRRGPVDIDGRSTLGRARLGRHRPRVRQPDLAPARRPDRLRASTTPGRRHRSRR